MRLYGLAALVIASAAAADAPPVNVTGQYSSNYEAVTLVQIGDRITGTYKCCGGGTIEGQLDGRTIHYRWKQPGSGGSGVWQVSPGRLEGTWGQGQDEKSGGRWDLVLVKPVQRVAN